MLESLSEYRKADKESVLRFAIRGLIILNLNALRKLLILFCVTFLLSSLFIILISNNSYFSNRFITPSFISNIVLFFGAVNSSSKFKDYPEDLGGDGPRVAAYLRVSGLNQVKGYSLEEQFEKMTRLKSERKPSRIYWFFDPGKSASRDYDKRKMNLILELREKKEIEELWAMRVDRMGREYRKMLYFYLDFSDDGGKIVTPEKEYSPDDFASELSFIIEARTAEQSNKDRTADVVAGKRRSFKHKHWNKPVPIGYSKDVWLKKISDYEPLIQESYRLFFIMKSIEYVRQQLNKKFNQSLPKSLSRSNVRRILSDPVYKGEPEHLGEVVTDPSLAFVSRETFQKSLDILTSIRQKYKPIRIGPLEKLAISEPISFLETLQIFELHHRDCGGLITKNGTASDEGSWQQLFKCKKCPAEWRLPPITRQSNGKLKDISEKDSMGGLVFDHRISPTKNNETTNKASQNGHINSVNHQKLKKLVNNINQDKDSMLDSWLK